jgi:polysaccharide export outer membrane protein
MNNRNPKMKLVRKATLGLSIIALASLSACASIPKIGGDPALQIASIDALPPPGANDIAKSNNLYTVGPYDKLAIDVWGLSELSVREIRVDANGTISVPMVGPMTVTGMTSSQLEKAIQERLRENHIRNPQVSVNLTEMVSHSITVDGSVKRPGVYPVAGGMTLMRSIAVAEGVVTDARLDDVVVFRTVDGKRYAALYNLGAIRRGRYPDPAIYANDIVMVGDDASRRLFKDLLTAVPAILTPIVILLTQN